MKRTVFVVSLLSLAIALTACGRRLPEPGTPLADTGMSAETADESQNPTEAPAEADTPDAEADDAEADTAEVVEAEADTAEVVEAEADTAEAVAVSGDAAAGDALFHEFINEVAFACSTCHNTNNNERLIGPGLLNIGEIAATRVDGQSAEAYIRQSIINPSAHLVEDYPDMLMPQTYADVFTDEQIENLVAYLLTL